MTEPAEPFLDFLSHAQPEPVQEPVVPNYRATEDRQNGRSTRLRDRMKEPREPRARKPPKPAPPYEPGKVHEAALQFYGMTALTIMPFKPPVAMAILTPVRPPTEEEPEPPSVAENCAAAWEAAAKHYPWVRRLVEGGESFAVIIGLIVAHAPIAAALFEGTEVAKRFNPATVMEEYLKRQQSEGTEAA